MLKKKLSSFNINKLYYKLKKKQITVETFTKKNEANKKVMVYKVTNKKSGITKNIIVKAKLRPLEQQFALTKNRLLMYLSTAQKFRNKFVDVSLISTLKDYYSSARNKNTMKIKTQNRASTILPAFQNLTVFVHNGKKFMPLEIKEHHVGYKLGEFIFTRKFIGHKKEGRKVVYKKKKIGIQKHISSIYFPKNVLYKKIKYLPKKVNIPKIIDKTLVKHKKQLKNEKKNSSRFI